jgi:hypothetical protein
LLDQKEAVQFTKVKALVIFCGCAYVGILILIFRPSRGLSQKVFGEKTKAQFIGGFSHSTFNFHILLFVRINKRNITQVNKPHLITLTILDYLNPLTIKN